MITVGNTIMVITVGVQGTQDRRLSLTANDCLNTWVTKRVQLSSYDHRRRVSRWQNAQRIACIHEQSLQRSENAWVRGCRSSPKSSTSRRWSQRRLTASRCDGASATVDTTAMTSKAARTRKRRRAGRYPFIHSLLSQKAATGLPRGVAVLRRRMYMSSQRA